jgi:sialidase-1
MRGKQIAALLCCVTPSCFASTALQETTVFQSGAEGYNTFRIPAIVQATDGTLLAFAEGRKNSSSDTGDIDTVLKRSTDGGNTWSALSVVSADGTNTVGNPSPVVDQSTGRILLLTTRNLGGDTLSKIDTGTSAGTRTVWSQYSDDNGLTWSTPVEITSSVKAQNWRWFATGPGHAIQLTRGSHAGRIVVASDFDSPTGNGAMDFYSDDHGASWHIGGTIDNTSSLNFNETTAAELVSGNIYFNSRNSSGSSPHHRSVSYSTDAGVTVTGRALASSLVDPVVQGSVVRYSAIDAGQSSNRLLFSNPDDPSIRQHMTIRSSFDESATWNAGKLVNRNLSGYSDLVTTSPGASGGLLYENGTSTSFDKITYASFMTPWLDDPTLAQYDFRGRSAGQTIASNAAEPDQRGNGLPGIIQGNPQTIAGDPRFANVSSTALHFDGVNDMIHVNDTSDSLFDFDAADSFTCEVDFRTTAHTTGGANSSGPLISKDVGPNSPSFWLRVENGHVHFFLDDGTTTASITSDAFVSDGNWHDIAAVRDTATDQLRLYVDQSLDSTAVDSTTGDFANANDLVIGAFNVSSANSKRFEGGIAFARVSEGALQPSEFVQFVPEPASAGLAVLAAYIGVTARRM